MTTHYAAVQLDTGTVYGIGTTPEEAVSDAAGWIDQGETTEDLLVVSCTPAAAAYVREHGGQSSARLSVDSDRGGGVRLAGEE